MDSHGGPARQHTGKAPPTRQHRSAPPQGRAVNLFSIEVTLEFSLGLRPLFTSGICTSSEPRNVKARKELALSSPTYQSLKTTIFRWGLVLGFLCCPSRTSRALSHPYLPGQRQECFYLFYAVECYVRSHLAKEFNSLKKV